MLVVHTQRSDWRTSSGLFASIDGAREWGPWALLFSVVASSVVSVQRLLAAEGISSQALARLQHGLAASAPGAQPLVIYRTAIYAEKWWQRGVVCLLSQTQRLDSAFLAYAQIAYSTPGLCSQRIIVLNDLIRRGFAS